MDPSSKEGSNAELLVEEVLYNRIKFKHLLDEAFMNEITGSVGHLLKDLMEIQKHIGASSICSNSPAKVLL